MKLRAMVITMRKIILELCITVVNTSPKILPCHMHGWHSPRKMSPQPTRRCIIKFWQK